MLPDRVSNPGPLTYESGVLPIALRGPAWWSVLCDCALLCCVSFTMGCPSTSFSEWIISRTGGQTMV